jgi:hypothetical protein
MGHLLIWRRVHAGLNNRKIQQSVIVASHTDPNQLFEHFCDDHAIARPSVQTKQDLGEGDGERCRVADESLDGPLEFASVISMAGTRRGSQPVVRVGLENRGARSSSFTSFPSKIARSTHLVQTTMGSGKRFPMEKGSLSSRLRCSIHIHDHPVVPQPIPQATRQRRLWRACHQILWKQEAQSLHAGLIDSGQKTAEGGWMRQRRSLEEGQKWIGKRAEACRKRFAWWFTTHGIPEKDSHNIDHLVPTTTSTGQTDRFFDGFQHAEAVEKVSKNDHVAKPGRGRGNGFWGNLDVDRWVHQTGCVSSLSGNESPICSLLRRHLSCVFGQSAPYCSAMYPHCASRGYSGSLLP